MMRQKAIVTAMLLLSSAVAAAQMTGGDPVARLLVAPEVIMKYQREIALTEAQGRTIKDAMQQAQSKFLEAQWRMQGESTTLVQLLNGRPIDEAAVLAQIDRVLNLEREIKRTQMSLLIRIKNTLTDEQIAMLTELRKREL